MKAISKGKELDEIVHWLTQASEIASYSNCTKSKRGVVIVKDGNLLSSGYIHHQEPENYCNPCVRSKIHDNSQRDLCGAEHAEQMALRLAKEKGIDLHDSRLYHIKVKNNQMVQSGKPSCEICSSLILDSGIAEVVLWHKSGYTVYKADEFDILSQQHTAKVNKNQT